VRVTRWRQRWQASRKYQWRVNGINSGGVAAGMAAIASKKAAKAWRKRKKICGGK